MWEKIKDKIVSAFTTAAITIVLALVLFFGIKYSSSFKNEVLLKASDLEIGGQNSTSEVYSLPSIEQQSGNFLANILPDLNEYNLSDADIENIAQTLNIDAASTKTQIEGIKILQSQIAPLIFQDNPEIIELFKSVPINDKDIKIDTSKDAGEKYLNSVSQHFKSDLPENALPPQLILLIKIAQKNPGVMPGLKNIDLQNPNIDKFLSLDLYIKSYKKLLADIKSLPVPKPWINLHKQEILTIQTTIASLTAAKDFSENELALIFAVRVLDEVSARMNQDLLDFKNSLKINWIEKK